MKLFALVGVTLLLGCAEPNEAAIAGITPANSESGTVQDEIETGQVKWLRNLDEAKQLSAKVDKPILMLFQEIPGCSTCQTFGREPMSHPLVVEAIESAFVPLLIHNNKQGYDSQILKQFKEPSWNNPVIRYVDKIWQGRDRPAGWSLDHGRNCRTYGAGFEGRRKTCSKLPGPGRIG